MKKIIGYTAGVFDLFHVGHLNILEQSKKMCDFLIVGISTDDVVLKNKKKKPIVCYKDRARIVEAIKWVDSVVPQTNYDIEGKIESAKKYKIDIMFVGSDWQGTDKWNQIENELSKIGCKVVYIKYTDGVSTTLLKQRINKDGQN